MPDWATVKRQLPVGKTPEHKARRKELWDQFNVTGTKHLALFEVDAGIQKVLQCEELFDAKPAIRRAFAYAKDINPKGPKDALEFCEFRLLLVFLQNLFDIYELFKEIDGGSRDMELSLPDFQAAWPKLKVKGISVSDPEALWQQLKGDNKVVEFNEFADWATREGLAGPELLEAEKEYEQRANETHDAELCGRLKQVLGGWTRCEDGLVSSQDLKALLKKLHAGVEEEALDQLLECAKEGGDKVRINTFVDSIVGA
eukprot:CAMPEP_0172660900 /NCGR_PEP_ID=MMETSP1074-20121228/4331_1 /TAXON_ID=2916 /ORGANISM="Ceratium fusus, Strain PA161109" /LENGTH=256 /DNA_ID=CAMNT_0013476563 /DNA_START=54 /DNA_END=824 /DNA_ORIENTATION=+